MSENDAGKPASKWASVFSILPSFLKKGDRVESPVLENLATAAEPKGWQKFVNLVGLGYVGNTIVSVATVNLVRKFFPTFCEKAEARYSKKYYNRKFEEIIAPIANELDETSRVALEEKIAEDARIYGEKTFNSRLLVSGGFAMLPFQSAMELNQHKNNIKPALNRFHDAAEKAGYAPEKTQTMLQSEIERQKLEAGDDKRTLNILDNAENPPKFSPLGPAARKGLPKWGTGRVLAIGAAFLSQGVVDTRLAKQKDALDLMLAKVVTRILHPKGYNSEAYKNEDFKESKPASTTPEGIDPKVWKVLPMVTTDAYMTSVALLVQSSSNKFWEEKIEINGGLRKTLEQKFTNSSPSP